MPEDISIVGFDDIALAAFVSPRLTTIRQPKQRIGELAAQLLIGRIKGQRDEVLRKVLEPELSMGDTTRALAGIEKSVERHTKRPKR